MNTQNLSDKITAFIPNSVVKSKTDVRPPEKTDELWTVEVDGQKFMCDRPFYEWSTFDQTFALHGAQGEYEHIFGVKDFSTVYSVEGRQWLRWELTPLQLLEHYLQNPTEYLRVMGGHFIEVQRVIAMLREVHVTMRDETRVKENLEKLYTAYGLFYHCACSLFSMFDDMIMEWKMFLMTFLPKKKANEYLSLFLEAEMTKQMLQGGAGNVVNPPKSSRGVLYGAGADPKVFYARPRPFTSHHPMDMEVMEALYASGASPEKIKRFFAFRMMVPFGMEANEEAQYVESQMLSAHSAVVLGIMMKKLGIDAKVLETMTYEEVLGELEKILPESSPCLPAGREGCVIPSTSSGNKILSNKLLLTGLPASGGIARGVVRIVTGSKDSERFQEGEILVTRITDPTMVVMMNKAGGIVTDIGGITSHPAILSREMGIPCVVNTKTATTDLKDGVMVEVDGTAGTVVILA